MRDPRTGDLLLPGASNDDDTGELARERREHEDRLDAYHAARSRGRWLGDTPGITVDFHQHDVEPGAYDLPPGLTDRQRWEADRSPHVFHLSSCISCGRLCTYYGRKDRMPSEPRCSDCTPPVEQ